MRFKEVDKSDTNVYSHSGNSTNTPNQNDNKKKWYQKTGWIILWLILFFPVGIFLMWKYSNWKKAVKIIVSAFFVLCIIGYCNAPELESIAISADTMTIYDINEQIEIKQKVKPEGYTISSSAFETTGGKIKESKGAIYFVSNEPGTFKVYAKSSGAKSNTLTFTIEDKTIVAEAKKKADKKRAEEAKKKADKKRVEEAKKKAEQERAEQERIAQEQAAQQAEQERIAQEQAAQQAEQERIAQEQAVQQQAAQQPQEQMVWISATGDKYHSKPNCGQMNPDTSYQMTLSEAQANGYEPCKRCH